MQVKVELHVDARPEEHPDTSTLGEYTDELDESYILRRTGQFISEVDPEDIPAPGREYRAFKPYAAGYRPDVPEYRECGLHDFERMEALQRGDWHFVYVSARAEVYKSTSLIDRHVATFHSPGTGGLESDTDPELIIKGVARDELAIVLEDIEEAYGITVEFEDIEATLDQLSG